MSHKLKLIDKKIAPGLKKIISNVGWLSAEKLLRMVISFFVGVYVIRYLGSESFGKLSYSVSFVALFTAISKLGLDQIVVRNLVKQEKLTAKIMGTAFGLKLLGSLLAVGGIGIAIANATADPQIYRLTIIIALSLIFSSFDVLDLWFQSRVMSKATAIVRSVQFILSSLAKLAFIFFQFPLMAFAYLLLVDSIVRALGMIFMYVRQNHSLFNWKLDRASAIALLKDSWPLILSGVMITLYMKIDQVMLGNMSDSQEVGNYAAAVRFSEIWYFVPTAICSSVFPSIIRAKQRSRQEYYGKLQQLYDLMAWMSFAIAIPMTFLSGTLIVNLLGAEYFKAGQILSIHIWAGLFVFLGTARSNWLMAENYTLFSFVATALGALTNIGLNLILIPKIGGMGAAWATIISYAISAYLTCLLYPPIFNTGSMLTKALLIPLRVRQNCIYINKIKKVLL